MKRIIISFLLLYLVTLMAGPVFAGGETDVPRDLRVAINPFSGNVGTQIFVSGSGAYPDREVIVTLSPQPNTAAGALATITASAAKDGTFSATLSVPDGTPDGRYYVRGEQFTPNGGVLHYYYNEFIVGILSGDALLPVTGSVLNTPFNVTTTLALLLVFAMAVRGIYAIKVGQ